MTRLSPRARDRVPVPTGRQAAAFDREVVADGVSGEVLMERAGTHAAQALLELHGAPVDRPVLVLAGRGNNGGDGLVLARCLHAWGVEVQVVQPDGERLGESLLHGRPVPLHDSSRMGDDTLEAVVSTASIVVDALLGTGATDAPRGEIGRLVESVRHARGPVVSLDVPSGVSADDGRIAGEAVEADATLCFGFPKLGVLLHPGRSRAGRVLALEIGFPDPPASGWYEALTPAWAIARRPRRRVDTHKNTAGVVTVIAGREGMAGAAILAARAALRSGAGFLRVAAPAALRDPIQSALPEAVFVEREDDAALDAAIDAAGALVVGPGMGTGVDEARLLSRVLARGRPTVLDADALTLLGGSELPRPGPDAILTPHPGEAARLLGREVSEVQADRLDALEALVDRYGCTILLKGTPSLVGSGDRRLIDTLGSSDLAVAGMGDTLAGAVASIRSQGASALEACGVGMAITSQAADRTENGAGLQAEDVADQIPGVLSQHFAPSGLGLPFVTLDLPPTH